VTYVGIVIVRVVWERSYRQYVIDYLKQGDVIPAESLAVLESVATEDDLAALKNLFYTTNAIHISSPINYASYRVLARATPFWHPHRLYYATACMDSLRLHAEEDCESLRLRSEALNKNVTDIVERKKGIASNTTSEGIRRPADGSPKPSM